MENMDTAPHAAIACRTCGDIAFVTVLCVDDLGTEEYLYCDECFAFCDFDPATSVVLD